MSPPVQKLVGTCPARPPINSVPATLYDELELKEIKLVEASQTFVRLHDYLRQYKCFRISSACCNHI